MTLPRLSDATAPALPYARGGLRAGIVHLGIGAFHRAHQAVYVDDLLAESPDWAILGASLRQGDTRDALAPQDGLYTVAVAGPQGVTRRVIGSVTGVLVGPEDPGALIAAMSAPAIRIVSMTVTEKGYCHDPATGALDEAHPDVAHDLRHPDAPRSAIGYLTAALARRRAAGIAPFTVLCCDNLPSNGRTVRRIVTRFAGLMDPALGAFVDAGVAFPCTMVDRIVPATTESDRAANDAALGLHDAWPVVTEPFTQWVIEDDFPAGRPDFARAGAQMVADVAPFERMKLRMLNGAHSTLAYLGYLAGRETVADAMADPPFAALARGLMTEEIMPVLEVPEGADLAGYRDALLARFANPGLRHRTWQIAMDGSQKLPQRLLGTARERLAAGLPVTRIALAVAGWMRYAAGTDEQGATIDVRDPLAARFREIAAAAQGDPARLAAGFLGLDAVFGDDLPRNPAFRDSVTKALTALTAHGARATVAAL
jgi:fructuronate reductase